MKGELNMNCKVIRIKKVIKDKTFHNYYLVFENRKRIPIKPSFNADYGKLSVVAELVEENVKTPKSH